LDDESYVACNVPLPALSFGGTSSAAFRSAFSLITSAKPIDVTDSSAMNESPAHLITNREFIGFSLYRVGGRKRHESQSATDRHVPDPASPCDRTGNTRNVIASTWLLVRIKIRLAIRDANASCSIVSRAIF
jgi:hypothetical protein